MSAVPIPALTNDCPEFLYEVCEVSFHVRVTIANPINVRFPVPIFHLGREDDREGLRSSAGLLFVVIRRYFDGAKQATSDNFAYRVMFRFVMMESVGARAIIPCVRNDASFVEAYDNQFGHYATSRFQMRNYVRSVPRVHTCAMDLIHVVGARITLHCYPNAPRFPRIRPFERL